jgi:hypothetical protein
MRNHEQITSKETRIRASPRVCQILLGKSCALPTSKKICQVKKEFISNNLAQFHLPNPDLTCIRNPERKKLIFQTVEPLACSSSFASE